MSEFVFKVVAIGDGGVGKTSIAMRYVYDKFDTKYKATIGVSYAVKKLVSRDKKITLSILDTGGQEMFDYIRPFYYKGASGALIVYDVTRKSSFDNLDRWFNNLYKQCGEIPVILVGNKTDLVDERVISTEDGTDYAQQRGVTFYETSAKTGHNVFDVMKELAKEILLDKEKAKVLAEKPLKAPKRKKTAISRFKRLFR
jgi:small GTP-binding protein